MTLSSDSCYFASFTTVLDVQTFRVLAPFGDALRRDFSFRFRVYDRSRTLLSNFFAGDGGWLRGDDDVRFGCGNMVCCEVMRVMTTVRLMMIVREGSASGQVFGFRTSISRLSDLGEVGGTR